MKANFKSATVWLAVILISAFSGYRLRAAKDHWFVAAGATCSTDDLVAPDSFSRVENARNLLEALCLRVRLRAETSLCQLKYSSVSNTNKTRQLQEIISDLRQARAEFVGTAQELELTHELLLFLKLTENYNEWIDVYLEMLYKSPTDPVIGSLAEPALSIARPLGREEELRIALKHTLAIPVNFVNKSRIEAAVGFELTRQTVPQGEFASVRPAS
jgi:hypothetical protein